MGKISEYMVPLGGFKIAEFICLLIGWATMADQFVKYEVENKGVRVNFFLAICIISWIFIIIVLVYNLKAKTNSSLNCIVLGVLHFILGVLVLIAASLVADTRCAKRMSVAYTDNHCGSDTYKTAGAFGIISAIILICDALYYIVDLIIGRKSTSKASKKYVAKDTEKAETSAVDSKADKPVTEMHEKSVDDADVTFDVPTDETCEKSAEVAQ